MRFFALVAVLVATASIAHAQDDKAAKKDAKVSKQKAPPTKSPSLMDVFEAGRKVIVFTYQDFNKIERPDGAFIPGADAARLKAGQREARPSAGGVTRLEITGNLTDAWAAFNVVVEARIDDPQGGDLVLAFNEAQCSEAELKFHDPAWDPSEFVPVEPAPIRKDDASSPYVLRLDRAGSYQLRLKLDVEIERGPVDRQLTLTLPKAPVKSVRLTETAVRPGLRIEGARRARNERDIALDPDGKTFAPRLLADESLDLRWRLVADAAGSSANAAYGLVARVRLRGRQLETTNEFSVSSRRDRREWIVRLPEGEAPGSVQVLQEGKALVAAMDAVKGDGGETRVRIQTADSVSGPVKLLATSSRQLPPVPASPESAVVEIVPASLENGTPTEVFSIVANKGEDEVRITPAPRADLGVESVPLERIDADVQAGPRASAFQFSRADGKLPLRLERLKALLSLAAPASVAFHFEPATVKVNAEFRLLVKQGRFESVQAALPANAEDVRATADGIACSAVPGEERPGGVRLWTFAFGERRVGEALLQLSASIPASGKVDRFPVPYLADVQDATTTVALTKAASVQVVLSPEELKEFQLFPSGSRSASPTWLSLQSRRRGATLAATTNRLHGKSRAAVEHRLSASDARLHVSTMMRWENRIEPLTEVRFNLPEGATDAVVKGDRLAVPPAGLTIGPGLAKMPLAAPAENCTVVVAYSVALSKDAATSIPLATPVADSVGTCLAELRAPSGRRPIPPPSWQPTSPDRHVGELLDAENPYVGLLVRSESPPTSLEWRSEPAGSLAEIVVPRMMIVEELASSGRRRGRLLAVLSHRRAAVCEILLPPGCAVAETYLDGKPVPVVSSARGERPSFVMRLPSDDRPLALEVRYEAVSKNLSAARTMSLDVPKLGGDVVVDQVLWRIAAPRDALLESFSEDVLSPAPRLWRIGRRLPGEWEFAPESEEPVAPSMAWINGTTAGLEWTALPPSFLEGRRWSFLTWGNSGTLRIAAVKEPFWILGASFLVLAAAAAVLGAKRRWRPWVVAAIGLAVGMTWLMSPRVIAWFWVGGRWAMAAVAVAFVLWGVRRLLETRRRRRLERRGYTLMEQRSAKTLALTNSANSSFRRGRTADATEIRG